MRNYTDLDSFASGVKKLNGLYKKSLGKARTQMPVLIDVDGRIAPFGLTLQRKVNGVECLVLTGCSSSMKNISEASRTEQIRTC